MKKEKILIWLLTTAIGVMLGWFLFVYEPPVERVFIESEERDTLIQFHIVHPKPDTVIGKAKIIYREIEIPVHHTITDTVLQTKPFTAVLDTVVRDTFNIRFDYPENTFSFVLRPAPDSIQVSTITITRDIERKKEWHEQTWFKVATHAIAILGTVYLMKD